MKWYGHDPIKGMHEISEQVPYDGQPKPEKTYVKTSKTTWWKHGTTYGYRVHKCRCPKCVKAYEDFKKRDRESKRQKRKDANKN